MTLRGQYGPRPKKLQTPGTNSLITKYWTQEIYSGVWVQGMKCEVVLMRHHVHTKCWWPSLKKNTLVSFKNQPSSFGSILSLQARSIQGVFGSKTLM